MSLTTIPKLIHWTRDAQNGHYPSATYYRRVIDAQNHLNAHRHRQVFGRAWQLGVSTYGYTGATTLARWRFRSGYGARYLRIVLVMAKDNTGGVASLPYATVTVGATTRGPYYFGVSATATDDEPTNMIRVVDLMAISPATTYECSLDTSDYARVMSIAVYELGDQTIDPAEDYFNGSAPQAGTQILDADMGNPMLALSQFARRNGGTCCHWGLINGAAVTRTSATFINLIDNATTGAPTTATPGWSLDTQYRNTSSRTTVPVELAVYGLMAGGSGTVKLVDSGGTTVVSVTVNSATPGWFTATGAITAASAAKYDLQFAGDGTNQISVYAVSFIEYES